MLKFWAGYRYSAKYYSRAVTKLKIDRRKTNYVGRFDLESGKREVVSSTRWEVRRERSNFVSLLLATILVLGGLYIYWMYFRDAEFEQCCYVCGEPIFWSDEEYVSDANRYRHVKCLDDVVIEGVY